MDVEDLIKRAFDFNNANGSAGQAFAIVKEYARSGNADPEKIPGLFHDLVTLFSTGKLPKKS